MNKSRTLKWHSWLCLVIATLLAIFSNGRWLIPLAAWAAPVFFLCFIHSQKPLPGLASGGLAMALVHVITWQEMSPIHNGALYVLIFSWIGILFWIPYCIARLLSPRIHGFASTLVFPLAFTSVEFIYVVTNPFLSNGSLAYTQYSSLPLLQIVSITGIWGITFLITWTASVINWVWEHKFAWNTIQYGVSICAGILITVFLFGEVRLTLRQPQSKTVRAATVTATQENIEHIRVAEENPDTATEHYQAVLLDYLFRTWQQALAGTKIVIWDELAIRTEFDKELAVYQQGRALAGGSQIYLLMALRVEDFKIPAHAPRQPRENKAILIGPDGRILVEYLKSFITPGDTEIHGDGKLAIVETSLGILAISICLDMDHPGLISQAGRANVGLMLGPAWNHPADELMQLNMARFRAIENGFSILRATREGLSAAFDNQGRLLALTGRNTADGMMVVNIPIESQWTLYPLIGDLMGWLCIAGLGILAVNGIISKIPYLH